MKNDIKDMNTQFIELVIKLKKENNDPLAIAGCMLAGAVQIYQSELGQETTYDLLDQIANGTDEDIELEIEKETYH
tara:strand:+ start:83 stop:310 length:228 start_codon:yes stop_codon:yes gene_type:complete